MLHLNDGVADISLVNAYSVLEPFDNIAARSLR